MQKISSIILGALLAEIILSSIGCGRQGNTVPTVSSVRINLERVLVKIGAEVQLTALEVYSDGSVKEISGAVIWRSLQPTVVGVAGETGLIYGIQEGKAILEIETEGGLIGSSQIEVYEKANFEFEKLTFPYGAMAITDVNRDSFYELLGTCSSSQGPRLCPDLFKGLEVLDEMNVNGLGRAGRDVRFADLNNDGIDDVVANVYSENKLGSSILLYWGNIDGTFKEDSRFNEAGYNGFGETIVVADFDNDEYLDFLIPQYQTGVTIYSRNLLFHNQKDGTFKKIAKSANVSQGKQYPEGAQAVDYDADGKIDLYVGGSMFRNLGDMTFDEVTDTVGLPGIFDEGAKFFDYNNDGRLDLILHTPEGGPRLFVWSESGKFLEKSDIFPSEYFQSSFEINVGDVDFDRFEDILIAGGYDEDNNRIPPRLWLNRKSVFVNLPFSENTGSFSDLVSFGDLDNNGSLDIIARYGGRIVYRNNLIPNYYVKLTVVRNGHYNQQGRVVQIKYTDDQLKAMVIDGGSGYMTVGPYSLLVGNPSGMRIGFKVLCDDKVIEFTLYHGNYLVDCGTKAIREN